MKAVFIILIFSNILFIQCKGFIEYFQSHKIRETLNQSLNFKNTAVSKEIAIYNFLNYISFSSSNNFNPYICNEQEYKESFLPNTIGENTITSTLDSENAWMITDIRRSAGIINIQRKLNQKTFGIQSIQFGKNTRNLNQLKGHIVESILLNVNGKKVILNEVKLIIEYKGQYKVCIVST